MVLEDILVLIIMTYGVSITFGYLLQRYLRMPWMFSSLFFGLVLSALGIFNSAIESDLFSLLQTLGMYLLLFIIGFSIDFKKMERLKNYVAFGTVAVIGLEGLLGSLLLYFVFPAEVSNSYIIALITALSFATVGEAVLLPILSEFKIIKTDFGQLTLGIGTLDDVVEVLMLAAVAVLPGFLSISQAQIFPNPDFVLLDLGGMLLLTFVVIKLGGEVKKLLEKNHPPSYMFSLLTLLVFFCFIALGGFVAESLATVGAIFGGISLRRLLPKERLQENERAVEFLGYIFLSPFFFLSVGASVSFSAIFVFPLLIALIWLVATVAKLLASYSLFHKLLGNKFSILLGFGLSVRFSTGLIVQYVLLNSQLISSALFSSLVATAIFMTPVIIIVYSWALSKQRPEQTIKTI
jgi:Kef-type K+ transport system membrane component KefB